MNTVRYTRPETEQDLGLDDSETFTTQADLINELIYRLETFTGQKVERPYPSWMRGWSWSKGDES